MGFSFFEARKRSDIVQDIEEKVKKVIYYSQGIDKSEDLRVDKVIDKWEKYKANKFSSILNDSNNYIYESEDVIELPLDDESKEEKFSHFLFYLTTLGHNSLKNFLEKQGVEGLFDNSVKEGYNFYDITIPKGMKLLKAMKYFVEDKETLCSLQNRASRIIQENKITGKLCISIHPLDYLSISENNHNWRSCHALDGEYRAGNFSYMMDPTTIVAYIKSVEDTILPHFPKDVPWNNKKWRVLIYRSAEGHLIFAGKQYPFNSLEALNKVKQIMFDIGLLSKKETWSGYSMRYSDWTNEYIESFKRFGKEGKITEGMYLATNNGEIVKKTDIVGDGNCTCHYNDVLYSSTYKRPYYAYSYVERAYSNKNPELHPYWFGPMVVGEDTRCLKCGQYAPEEDSFLCPDCIDEVKYNNNFRRCDNCHAVYNSDEESFYTVDDMVLCSDCYEDITDICDYCGNVTLSENCIYEDDLTFCCRECMDEYYNQIEEEE